MLDVLLVICLMMKNEHKVKCVSQAEYVNRCPHGISSWDENNR